MGSVGHALNLSAHKPVCFFRARVDWGFNQLCSWIHPVIRVRRHYLKKTAFRKFPTAFMWPTSLDLLFVISVKDSSGDCNNKDFSAMVYRFSFSISHHFSVCNYATHFRCVHKVLPNCSLNSPLAKQVLPILFNPRIIHSKKVSEEWQSLFLSIFPFLIFFLIFFLKGTTCTSWWLRRFNGQQSFFTSMDWRRT